jgi:EmrB/QacA subfamily drug resistance transporter
MAGARGRCGDCSGLWRKSAGMDADVNPAPHAIAEALPNYSHAQIIRVITGILLCILLAAIDQTVVVPAVPAIAADLHGFGHLAWIVSAYLLTSTSATPIYGRLSDIYGRRALLLPAIVIFVIASLLCGGARTLWQLIVFRALQGIGGGGLMAMAQAAIADVVAPRERGKYQAYMAGTWGVASIAGPILGGWMTDALSWRWIFWINVPIGVAAFVLSNRALKLLPLKHQPVRIDYVGAALLTFLVAAVLLVMSWGGNEFPWDSAPVMAALAAAVALLAALIWRERTTPEPLLPPRLFANSVFSRGVVIGALTAAAMFGGTFLLPLLFQLLRGADASASGTLIVPFLASNVVGAYVSGQLARRYGRAKPIVLAGLAMAAAGFALLGFLGAHAPGWRVLLEMVVVGFGLGVVMPASLVMVQNAAERRDVGVATGTLLFLRAMGAALGSTLVGALLAGRFAAGLAARGITARIDLGALREHAAAALDPGPGGRAAAEAALIGAFHASFLTCAGLAGMALLIGLGLADLPLKSSAAR